MSLVCFGDSVTYGQGLDDPSTQAFPALLGAINKGYCGDTTRLGLERFGRDVQQSGCDTVLIQFGHNDCNSWDSDGGLPRVTLDSFVANLKEMKERAAAFGMNVILLAPHPTKKKDRQYEARRKVYAHCMNSIARTIDAGDVDLLDHIHPSAYGHEQIQGAVWPLIPHG